MSPANFLLTNPEAQQRLVETHGESLRQGMQNLLGDLQQGRISHTDQTAFEVGRNLATSPGAVVYQNELIQLIQYAPSTPTVGSRPLLMVPPCINKFYILDLQPENSLVAYAVAQGHTVYMLSWKNPKDDAGPDGWDDYLQLGIVDTIGVVQRISGQRTINALGFCVGGTILCTALAALAAKGERPVEAMTLLTTLLDFADPGVRSAFSSTRCTLRCASGRSAEAGSCPARSSRRPSRRSGPTTWSGTTSSTTISRARRRPPSTCCTGTPTAPICPGPMYCWYLRHTYLQNELREPRRLICGGVPVDLGEIDVPTYLYGSREDHIVPWHGAYQSTRLLSGPLRFVLGASGHIAGVINPAAKGKRSYWIGDIPA